MKTFVLKTRLADNFGQEFYFKGTEEHGENALDTMVALDISNATEFDKESASELCKSLNKDKQILEQHGYTEFEVCQTNLSLFEQASRYAVNQLDKKEMYDTLGEMQEHDVPLYMVGGNVCDDMQQLLNEWGEEHGLEEEWFNEYGDEEDALFIGYNILEDEGKIPRENG